MSGRGPAQQRHLAASARAAEEGSCALSVFDSVIFKCFSLDCYFSLVIVGKPQTKNLQWRLMLGGTGAHAHCPLHYVR